VGALRTKITDLSFLSLTELVDPELGLGDVARLVCSSPAFSDSVAQALVSFKKYMPPPVPYFKVNICPLPLPHFASIFFAYL
jgi:hypothetical protein